MLHTKMSSITVTGVKNFSCKEIAHWQQGKLFSKCSKTWEHLKNMIVQYSFKI